MIPRPARACADPPLYLRLRMGKPNGKSMPLPSYVMSYGKNKLRPEFWFSIPKNRTDELYRFLNTWVPQLYGELDEEAIQKRGFELIQNDTDWVKSGQNKVWSSLDFYAFLLNTGLFSICSKVWLQFNWIFKKLSKNDCDFIGFDWTAHICMANSNVILILWFVLGWAYIWWWRYWRIDTRVLGGKSHTFHN